MDIIQGKSARVADESVDALGAMPTTNTAAYAARSKLLTYFDHSRRR
jgi:hypothetical protein